MATPARASFEDTRLRDSLIRYYDDTWLDYRLVWLKPSNFAIHFGYHDDERRSHADALVQMNRVLADLARIGQGQRVLDAGCGVGGSSLWLAEHRGAQVLGITPVSSQVARARAFARHRGLSHLVRYRLADYADTGLPSASFDAVWALESLCHAPDKAAVYREFARVLRPGGRLVIAEYARSARPLPPWKEQLLSEWLSGWMIPDLDTPDEHQEHAMRAGFSEFVLRDITRHTRPSLRRLYAATFLGVPIDRVLGRLGLRNEVQHGNVIGSRRQYEALRSQCWLYTAISATRA
jgi:tocopherol O-methyltransferase